jgi:hypothetical protein
MKIIIYSLMLLCCLQAAAQKNKQVSIAFMNAATATPFSQFGKLLTAVQHPGVEFGYSFNWRTKSKHDWYQEVKLSYFYHRFVQHAIQLYTGFGYQYKFSSKWAVQTAIGAGYMHSIPATAQLKLQDDGNYTSGRGIGRMQAMGTVNIGIAHTFNPNAGKPITMFVTYQQILQTPFINAYVPLLPYNSLLIGISTSLNNQKK